MIGLLLPISADAAYYPPRAAGGDDLAAQIKESEEIKRLADESVAHLSEARRAGAGALALEAIRLNRRGFTCAEVVNASSLPGTDAMVVTCLVARFENQTIRYRIVPRTGETTTL